MIELETSQTVPLTAGEDAVIRITGSRVTLDSIVGQFKRGATAEEIQHDFPSLSLREIYGAISYYLEHADRVEEHLRAQEQSAAHVREQIENERDTRVLRERLRSRRSRQAWSSFLTTWRSARPFPIWPWWLSALRPTSCKTSCFICRFDSIRWRCLGFM